MKFKVDPASSGTLFILYGPSSSGKTMLSKALDRFEIPFLVSHTTREMRAGESEGVDYHYVNDKEFDELNLFEEVEHAGNRYGLAEEEFIATFKHSDVATVVTEIEGIKEIESHNLPIDIVKVFVIAPEEEIIDRLSDEDRISRYIHDRKLSRHNDFNKLKADELIYNKEGKFGHTLVQFFDILRRHVNQEEIPWGIPCQAQVDLLPLMENEHFYGNYYRKEQGRYIAYNVHSESGGYVEEFDRLESCLYYLIGYEPEKLREKELSINEDESIQTYL